MRRSTVLSQRRLSALIRSGARLRWRPGLRTVVVAPTVAVVLGMAFVVSISVADELRRSATESAIHNVEAIVRGYVDPALAESSLDIGAPRDAAIDDQLVRLTQSGDIRRINLWSRDGRIVYSSEPDLRGQRFSIGPLLASAYAGDGVGRYVDGAASPAVPSPRDSGSLPPLPGHYLELFVPIRGLVDGNPIGVYVADQDARLIEQRIAETRSGVFVVAVVASSLLLGVLWFAFGGASRVLAVQNRRLQEQAMTERLLHVDLQRSEERFRSLVRNASDGVVVLGKDGLVRYESPAIERILGRRAEDGVGRPATDVIHPDDRSIVRRGFAEVSASSGSQVALEFRASHIDGTWRTLEAIAKNLLNDPAVGGVVVNYRDITERKVLEEQLRHQAFHDGLTGLANRALFKDRLGHALARASRGGRPTAVLYLDLDDFKAVNDRLGHVAGDRLLVAVGDRLRASTRDADTVARLGGDEFAIIVEETEPDEAAQAAQRILDTLAPPFTVGDSQIVARASIGIAIRSVDSGDADELLRRADIAMYAVKARGGSGHAMYDPELYDATVARLELKADLPGALDRGEMHVAYQPIVDIASGAIIGSEALIRWDHPRRGPIPPLDFIPLAEESGQILDLGRWVLESACRQTRAWQTATANQDLTISVNLSGRQVADPNLVADVDHILSMTGLDPERLTLEITESVLIHDIDSTITAFRALKALGIRLAIDDFGTGYSSLSYLRQFPIDILKIDRSFVASLDGSDDSIGLVRSILDLSATLRLDTVAEGIETAEQRVALRGLGAQRGQGHLFARPMRSDALGDLLARGSTDLAAVPAPGPSARTRTAPGDAPRPRSGRRTDEPRVIRT
ncbi:MAG: putative bifunctional diguanylate cyclase/phosphodiesterase [Candidatus Limnocylindrales bacterium]